MIIVLTLVFSCRAFLVRKEAFIGCSGVDFPFSPPSIVYAYDWLDRCFVSKS